MRGVGSPHPTRGSQFVADDDQAELRFLGIESSPAFVREPEGNGSVERFIRTLKENLPWVHRFDTIEELHRALHRFKDTDNRTWIVERHGYQTPAAVGAAQRGVSPLWPATLFDIPQAQWLQAGFARFSIASGVFGPIAKGSTAGLQGVYGRLRL